MVRLEAADVVSVASFLVAGILLHRYSNLAEEMRTAIREEGLNITCLADQAREINDNVAF